MTKTRQIFASALALAAGVAAIAPVFAADIVKFGTGGAYLAAATSDDDSRGARMRQQAFTGGTEIQFKGRTMVETSLEVGFHTEISRQDEAGRTVQRLVAPGRDAPQLRAMFVYVKTGIGTFALGDQHARNGATGNITPYLTGTGLSGDDSIALPIFRPIELHSADAQDTRSLRKVSYFTPRFGGVQFGVSFNADSPASGPITLNLPSSLVPQQHGRTFELNANYKTAYKGVEVELGGSYLNGRSYLADQSADVTQWGASGALGYALPRGAGDLALAGSYRASDCTDLLCGTGTSLNWLDSGIGKAWNVGLRYSLGPWNVGGYFLTGRTDTLGGAMPTQNSMVFLQTSIDF